LQQTDHPKFSLEELLNFSANRYTPIPDEYRPHLFRLLNTSKDFNNCPITRQVAALLVCKTTSTLAVMASNRDFSLPFYKSGRSVRYALGDIKNYLNKSLIQNEVYKND